MAFDANSLGSHQTDLLLCLCALVSLKLPMVISKCRQRSPDAAFPSLDPDDVLSSHLQRYIPGSFYHSHSSSFNLELLSSSSSPCHPNTKAPRQSDDQDTKNQPPIKNIGETRIALSTISTRSLFASPKSLNPSLLLNIC